MKIKRYALCVEYGEAKVYEHPLGNYVKWENIKDRLESAGVKIKEPDCNQTICAECSKRGKELAYGYDVCIAPVIDYVTGRQVIVSCRDKNHGACPDWEPKTKV